uniref:(northern house mosquito) hypothetical protein n=1 Tax=Culex pipiens TaxID=7175 RepID=A0A8D8MHK7_CULPI
MQTCGPCPIDRSTDSHRAVLRRCRAAKSRHSAVPREGKTPVGQDIRRDRPGGGSNVLRAVQLPPRSDQQRNNRRNSSVLCAPNRTHPVHHPVRPDETQGFRCELAGRHRNAGICPGILG